MLSDKNLRTLTATMVSYATALDAKVRAGQIEGLTGHIEHLGIMTAQLHLELTQREAALTLAADPRTMAYYLPGLDNPALREG